MARGFLPVVRLEGETGQRPAALEGLGVLLDETEVVAVGLLEIAAPLLDPGVEEPRLAVASVELEDVAELYERALRVARLRERDRALEMLPDLLLGRLARRERERRDEDQGHE